MGDESIASMVSSSGNVVMSKSVNASMVMKGHEFVQISYHMPATCDSCAKPLWAPFRPPPALECKRCRAKFHKEHVLPDSKSVTSGGFDAGVAPCKVSYDPTTAKDMLLLAPTSEEQQIWVARLLKKIQKSGYRASMMTSVENNGAGSRANDLAPMRSASQRSAGGPPASLASVATSSSVVSSQKSATLPTPTPTSSSTNK